MLKTDESMQVDGTVEGLGEVLREGLENEVSPSEIFAARCELELAGKIKQLSLQALREDVRSRVPEGVPTGG